MIASYALLLHVTPAEVRDISVRDLHALNRVLERRRGRPRRGR